MYVQLSSYFVIKTIKWDIAELALDWGGVPFHSNYLKNFLRKQSVKGKAPIQAEIGQVF